LRHSGDLLHALERGLVRSLDCPDNLGAALEQVRREPGSHADGDLEAQQPDDSADRNRDELGGQRSCHGSNRVTNSSREQRCA
jgi:hypothetical protein